MNTDAAPAKGGGRVVYTMTRYGTVVLAGGGLGQIRAGQHIQVGTAGLQSEQLLRRRPQRRNVGRLRQHRGTGIPQTAQMSAARGRGSQHAKVGHTLRRRR